MNDPSQGEPPEPLQENPGANGAVAGESTDSAGALEPEGQAEVEALRGKVAALSQEVADAKDLARRAQADIANVRRRSRNERAEFRSRATEEVCSALLPVLDDLHRAVVETGRATDRWSGDESGESAESVVQGLLEGVRLVLRRFQDTLKRQGLVEIEADGAPFDPRLHAAVQEAPAGPGQREGDVIQVLQRGYLLDGRVTRPAAVVVASAAVESPDASGEADGDNGEGSGGSTAEPGGPGSGAEPPTA